MRRFFDYLFLYRWQLIVPGLTFILLGYYRSDPTELTSSFFYLIFGYILIMGSMNIVNELFDIKTDKLNTEKDFLIHKGVIKARSAMIFLFFTMILGLLITSLYQ